MARTIALWRRVRCPAPAHRGGLRWLLLAGCLLLVPATWAAQDDALLPIARSHALFERLQAVGQVFTGFGRELSMGSGFLVSACHVLSAGHVLARPGEAVRRGLGVRFLLPSTVPPQMVDGRVVAASPQFIMQLTPTGFDRARIAHDWVLIELDRPVAGVAPIRLLHPDAAQHNAAFYTVAGYPLAVKKPGLHAHAHCPRWTALPMPDILLADCAIQSGMSGGPMLLDDTSEPLAAGILVERFTMGQKVMAIGVPLAAFAREVEPIMRDSDICAVGAPFALPAGGRE